MHVPEEMSFALCERPQNLTSFQWQVLQAALRIPFGQTRSYRWVAESIGRPGAVRAVGQALRRNPFPLLIPCHRVVQSDGKAGGYAGKHDGRKEKLIAMEKSILRKMGESREAVKAGRLLNVD